MKVPMYVYTYAKSLRLRHILVYANTLFTTEHFVLLFQPFDVPKLQFIIIRVCVQLDLDFYFVIQKSCKYIKNSFRRVLIRVE